MPNSRTDVLSTTPDIAYAVLDTHGRLLPEHSRAPHSRQDTASTAKLWTLYTLLSMERDGRLPEGFLNAHRTEIQRMVIESHNVSALRVASAAVGQELSPERLAQAGQEIPPPEPFMVPAFTREMNRYAQAQGLRETHFVTVNGQPTANHYSTPHDMARMMFVLQRDFGDHPVVQRLEAVRSGSTSETIYAASAAHGREDAVLFGKTGSGTGQHGVQGERHYVGQTRHGFFALTGADDPQTRVQLVCALAASIPATTSVAATTARRPVAPAAPSASAASPSALEAAIASVILPNQLRIVDANDNGRVSAEEYAALFCNQGGLAPLRAALASGGILTSDEFFTIFQRQLDAKSNAQLDALAQVPEIARRLKDTNRDGTLNHVDIRAQLSPEAIRAMRADDGSISRNELIAQLPIPRPTGGRSIS